MRLHASDGRNWVDDTCIMQKEFPGIQKGKATETNERYLELPIDSIKNEVKEKTKKVRSPEDTFLAENM